MIDTKIYRKGTNDFDSSISFELDLLYILIDVQVLSSTKMIYISMDSPLTDMCTHNLDKRI